MSFMESVTTKPTITARGEMIMPPVVVDNSWRADSVTDEEFEAMVGEAFDEIPDEFSEPMQNMLLVIEDEREGRPNLLGLYEGVPQTKRPSNFSGHLPDRITIFRNPIMRICWTRQDVAAQVRKTVFHEYGHLLGMSEQELHALGWG